MDQCPGKCRGCPKMSNPQNHSCFLRVQEWVKNIEVLMSKQRPKGEGQAMAEEVIEYMRKSFMGGIN
jgi:hypothetical protein